MLKSYQRFSNMWSCNLERNRGNLIFWWGQYSTEGEKSNFWACRETPQLSPLVEHPDFPIRKNLIRVVGLLSVMILKRVGDTIFFQSERFTACKVKEEKRSVKFKPITFFIKIKEESSSNVFLVTVNDKCTC